MEDYQIYIDGRRFQKEYIDLILSAEKKISLHTYIFAMDEFGENVFDALIDRAHNGVKIEILADYFGSFELGDYYVETLQHTPNIIFQFFNPIKAPKILQMGRRLHHKILTIDNRVGMVGGINIINGLEPEHPEHPRLDFAVKIKGPLVREIEKYCQVVFKKARGKLHFRDNFEHIQFNSEKVRVKVNDWFIRRSQISKSYYRLVNNAKKNIILIHGYFFPSFRMMHLLRKKAREGVSVVVILPKHSDWTTWTWATEYLYSDLMKEKVIIMEWLPSNLHGKMAIFDEEIITLGSHNLNYTSSYGNLEMNVEIRDSSFTREIMESLVPTIFNGCDILTPKKQKMFSWPRKMRDAVFYTLLMIVAGISIGLMKFGRRIANMGPLHAVTFFFCLLLGFTGALLPLFPGFPFFITAILLYIGKRKNQDLGFTNWRDEAQEVANELLTSYEEWSSDELIDHFSSKESSDIQEIKSKKTGEIFEAETRVYMENNDHRELMVAVSRKDRWCLFPETATRKL